MRTDDPTLIPICMHCKRIRDPHGSWREAQHHDSPGAMQTHCICPACLTTYYGETLDGAVTLRRDGDEIP